MPGRFNIRNGVLTDITVFVSASEVGDRKVSELGPVAKDVMDALGYTSAPRALKVAIVFQHALASPRLPRHLVELVEAS